MSRQQTAFQMGFFRKLASYNLPVDLQREIFDAAARIANADALPGEKVAAEKQALFPLLASLGARALPFLARLGGAAKAGAGAVGRGAGRALNSAGRSVGKVAPQAGLSMQRAGGQLHMDPAAAMRRAAGATGRFATSPGFSTGLLAGTMIPAATMGAQEQ